MLQLRLEVFEVICQLLVIRVPLTRKVLCEGRSVEVLVLDAVLTEGRVRYRGSRPFWWFDGLGERGIQGVTSSRGGRVGNLSVLTSISFV